MGCATFRGQKWEISEMRDTDFNRLESFHFQLFV